VKQERDVSQAENSSLRVSLGAKSDNLVAPGLPAAPRDHRFVDVLRCDQVENDRDEPCVLDPLVATGQVVDRDSRPENLTDSKPTCRRVEASVQLVDFVREELGNRGSEDARKLGLEPMAKRAVERFARAGVEGLPRWRWRSPAQV
jgi:hypothetical protein